MQRLTTPIPAEPASPAKLLEVGSRASQIARPLTLSDALRQDLSWSCCPGNTAEGVPQSTAHGRTIGRVEMVEASGGPLSVDTDGCSTSARVTALVQIEGSTTVAQGERTAEIGPGDLCLMRSGRPLKMRVDGPFRMALVEAPEDEIADRFPLWRAAMLTPIRGSSGVPAVFCDAVRSVHRWQDSIGAAGSDGLADALIDLMGALVCFAVPANRDCVQQSLYQKDRIKKVIQLNLRNADLDVDYIAESVGLSPRQVHRLFADEGMSLMRWVWVQRLEQCFRELGQDETGKRSISDVAYTWGFTDQAHFSRAFRKQFGISPRDVRRKATGPTSASDSIP
jgi:AraC family transcriptional regulator, positive regulator of tynA and feaB